MEFSLEGTTWEKWDELCKAYNLKDKVDFERGNIDRNEPNIIEPID